MTTNTTAATTAPSKSAVLDLPVYQCHKRVQAAPIHSADPEASPPHVHVVVGGEVMRITVPIDFFARGIPAQGDYLVRYQPDGYLSWSPKAAFDGGYALVPPTANHEKPVLEWQFAPATIDFSTAHNTPMFIARNGTDIFRMAEDGAVTTDIAAIRAMAASDDLRDISVVWCRALVWALDQGAVVEA